MNKEPDLSHRTQKVPPKFTVSKHFLMDSELTNYFTVSQPIKEGDHYVFTVQGMYHRTREPFRVLRRYNHFYTLRQAWIDRLPGFYIPPLPKKKAIGNTNH